MKWRTPEGDLDRLLELCEMQIEAVLKDSDTAFSSLTSGAIAHEREIGRLHELLVSREAIDGEVEGQFEAIRGLNNEVVMRLQFLDEYTQRVGHIKTLVELLRQGKDVADVLDQAASLFATRAEHEVLASLLGAPVEVPAQKHTSDIELF